MMEIGGVKQKVIAGHRAGLKTIVLPKNNNKDMELQLVHGIQRTCFIARAAGVA